MMLQITRFLFASPPNQYGKDLLAIDITRGRDHGLPPYSYFRKLCGLRPIYSFDEFKRESKSVDIVNQLKGVYRYESSVLHCQSMVYGDCTCLSRNYFEDLDLIVGLIMEQSVHGSLYGPTTVCIMGEQYYRLKYGDRFWFENLYHPGAFNKGKQSCALKGHSGTPKPQLRGRRHMPLLIAVRNIFPVSMSVD